MVIADPINLGNPAYVDPAPCPCNLMRNACDVGCCCDPDCTGPQLGQCLLGTFGGSSPASDKNTCQRQDQLTPLSEGISSQYFSQLFDTNDVLGILTDPIPEYAPLMCLAVNNSASLGLFYAQIPLARSTSEFQSQLAGVTTAQPDSGMRSADSPRSAGPGTYLQFDPILMLSPNLARPILQLPYFNNDACDANAPLQFLGSRTVKCPLILTSTLCNQASTAELLLGLYPRNQHNRIDARSYLLNANTLTQDPGCADQTYLVSASRLANFSAVPLQKVRLLNIP
ncbi:1-acylglycerol-3-phosphate O-acyltransferase 6 (lysophosphatidic acid acyltransferase, zeta) [Cichlidogyrus casuarinus]|uniref:1-acylglycerol-3-phosphate O-acyltransferase 6 (Lysophosphatidic acid acyltransferase, zeta) n=1 Tax=Cichlidogyrus casuarinus TaxID=1844966 RepID=A0ABD2PN22_9PLAT